MTCVASDVTYWRSNKYRFPSSTLEAECISLLELSRWWLDDFIAADQDEEH